MRALYSRAEYRRLFGATEGNRALFRKIYAAEHWGKSLDEGPFYSGPGSDPENAAPYVKLVNDYIRHHRIRTVLDLGCGDFRVGRRLALESIEYVGADIVPEVIAYNKEYFLHPNVRFVVLDAVSDDLPPADLVLVRQVLQHLSNDDILKILPKLGAFKHAIVADELPATAEHSRNLDVIRGGSRMERNSGLYLEDAPFSCQIKVLADYPVAVPACRIRVIEVFPIKC